MGLIAKLIQEDIENKSQLNLCTKKQKEKLEFVMTIEELHKDI